MSTRTVQPTESTSADEAAVWDYLAVGGTWTTQHHMVGQWRVEIYLDELSGTPSITKTFTLAGQ